VNRTFCEECGSNLFIRNPKFESAVIVASGTLDFEGGLKGWRPVAEFYCKRRGEWLAGVGAVDDSKFDGMT
jgi:hypothetical protein